MRGTRPAVVGSRRPDVGGPPEVRRAPHPRARATCSRAPHRRAPGALIPMPRIRPVVLTAVAALALAVVRRPEHPAGVSHRTATTSATFAPVTIDNCGIEVTFEAAPERVVTIKSLDHSSCCSRSASRTASSAPRSPTARARRVRRRGIRDRGRSPTRCPRRRRCSRPSPTSSTRAGSRTSPPTARATATRCAKLGVAPTSPRPRARARATCRTRSRSTTSSREFEEVGAIFDVPDAAADLVADPARRARRDRADDAGLTALWYTSGRRHPLRGRRHRRAADDHGRRRPREHRGRRRGHLDLDGLGGDRRRRPRRHRARRRAVEHRGAEDRALESNPATAALPAVRSSGTSSWTFPATEAGVRNVDAVASLVDQLGELGAMSATRAGTARPTGPATDAARPRPPARRTGLRTGALGRGPRLLLVATVVVAVTIGPADLILADVWARCSRTSGSASRRSARCATASCGSCGCRACSPQRRWARASRSAASSCSRSPATRWRTPTCSACRRARRSGAVVVLVVGVTVLLPVAAFAGALVALVATLALANAVGALTPTRTVLAGLAVSAVVGASRASSSSGPRRATATARSSTG